MTESPRQALARALYVFPQHGMRVGDKEFNAAWEWMLDPKNAAYVADSDIGKIVARVDAVLRWIDAAGLEVKAK